MVVESWLFSQTKAQPKQPTPKSEVVKETTADEDFVETVNGVSLK